MHYYVSMTTIYMISTKLEHYTYMVNLLGHVDHLQEAENMIKVMPYELDVATWKVLFGAFKIHGNVEMGEFVAKRVLELELENVTGFVMLSNIYDVGGNINFYEDVE